ncbi:MAG: hydrogenase expression/formation protein HypE [Hyphomonas sp.]|uniref:hydrogenase expression/formation protein HypE n=1 Tax=Hyphomonas sp. TaxID=87 RepID=UPI003528D802
MSDRRLFTRRIDLRKGHVELVHGAGGKASAQLFEELFRPAFSNPALDRGDDSACLTMEGGRIVVATDGHVVSPLFFPGGDIGSLAVHGTVNDLAMGGATPRHLTAGFILEEGFPFSDLKRIVDSMAAAAAEAGVTIVAGDTKVVERGKGDGIFITTTGLGILPADWPEPPGAHRARPGDVILVSGTLGDHGTTILAARDDLPLMAPIESDTAPLHGLVSALHAAAPGVRTLRDPTRGGFATAINEICRASGTGALVREPALPIRRPVEAACEILGVDPLYLANEGKLIAIVPPAEADAALAALKSHPLGADAAIVGEIVADEDCFVQVETVMGGRRMLDWLVGDPLPRIC